MGRQILKKEYTVEKILDWKVIPKTKKKEYLVKWKGYPKSESTWEPPSHLPNELVRDYEESIQKQPPKLFDGKVPEKLLGKKVFNSKTMYKVKWRNLPKTEGTWELEDSISKDLIAQFNEAIKKQMEKKGLMGKRPAQEDISPQVPVKIKKVLVKQEAASPVQIKKQSDVNKIPEIKKEVTTPPLTPSRTSRRLAGKPRLSIAEKAQQLKEMLNSGLNVKTPEIRRRLDKSKVTRLPEKSPIRKQPEPIGMSATNPVTTTPKVVSHGNLFEKISEQFSPPPTSPLKKSSTLDNKVKEVVQKNAENVTQYSMPEPSNFESSSKASLEADLKDVDVDTFLSPADKIDLTKDDLAFDVGGPSTTETADNDEQIDATAAADQDKVANVEEKVTSAPLVVSNQAVDTSLHKPVVKPIPPPMEEPSTKEVEKIDFDAFILEKKKAAEAPKVEEFVLDEVYSPKKFTHIPEKLSKKRVTHDGTLYFVKWQGLPKAANTWEKLEDLEVNYQGIIDKFEMLYKLQEDRKKKMQDAKQNVNKQSSQTKLKEPYHWINPKAFNRSATPVVPQSSSKIKKYTKEDIQEMLGRHMLDNKVVYAIKLKGQSEVKYVQKKDLDCPGLIKEADRKYQEELKAASQTVVTQPSTAGRSKRKRKMNSKYADDFVANGLGYAMGLSASLYEQERSKLGEFSQTPSIQLTPPGSPIKKKSKNDFAPNASRTLNKTAKNLSHFGKTEKSSKKMGRPRKVDPGQPKQNGRPRKLDLITDYTSPTAMHVAQKAKSIQVKSKWWKRGIPVVKVTNGTKSNGKLRLKVIYEGIEEGEYIPAPCVYHKFPKQVIEFFEKQIFVERLPPQI